MNWWHPTHFDKKRLNLMRRAQLIKAVRQYFDQNDFIEVETPALQICPGMDAHIHGFKTSLESYDGRKVAEYYLHNSPEFDMKKLLTAGLPKIYQLCHVYRNREVTQHHHPEFTLLEWYRADSDYTVLMDECVDMIRFIAQSLGIQTYQHRGIECDPFQEWERISVSQAFLTHAEMDIVPLLDDVEKFKKAAENHGVRVTGEDNWDDIFHAVMDACIEPYLGQRAPVILYDYPVSMAALSRRKPEDPRFAERFELYMCGVETANAFSELTDAQEQRQRFHQEMSLKQSIYGEKHPADDAFFSALDYGMPESAGIALGIDRLVMLACGADAIEDVLWAPLALPKDDL